MTKKFFSQKMDWLVEVAGTPGMSLRALAAAVACADAAFAPGVVRKTQSELSDRLGKPQSAISPGCRELVRLGFLRVRQNGNRSNYSLNFDVNSRQSRQSVLPHTLKQYIRRADETVSAPPYIEGGLLADEVGHREPIARSVVRVDTTRAADEHYNRTPVEGRAYSARPEIGDVDRSVRSKAMAEIASAPEVARPDRLESEAERIFGRPLRDDQVIQCRRLIETLGREDFGQRLQSYELGVEAGIVRPISIAKWLRQGGLVEVSNVA